MGLSREGGLPVKLRHRSLAPEALLAGFVF